MKLYEFKEEFIELQSLLENEEFDSETGELIDNSKAIADLFSNLKLDFQSKMDSSAYVVDELMITAKALKEEATRLTTRAKRFEKNANYLKDLMLNALIELPDGKLKTDRFNFTTRRSTSIEVLDSFNYNGKYVRVKEIKEADKTAIKKALKDGEVVSGINVVENISLQIK